MPHLKSELRCQLIVASQRLATKTGLYPTCYDVGNIDLYSQDPIAAGGFCDIYKGRFRGQVVSLKTIRIYENDIIEYALKQISKEVLLWGQLSHPNVLPIYGVYRFRGRICIVSPWMEAGDINRYIKSKPDAYDVVEGLLYLHKNGIVHGDLKGPNILVNDAGRACLTDFGISSVVDEKILAWTSYSSATSKGGSVRWQAPELFNTKDDRLINNTTESDVYAWACVCYEIFTGDTPFTKMSDSRVMFCVMSGERPTRPPDSSPAWRSWGLTENIWLLMQECWALNPKERPTTEQLRHRLAAWLVRDQRSSASDSVLAPALFRAKMGPPAHDPGVLVSNLESLFRQDMELLPVSTEEGFSSGPITASDASLSLDPNIAFGGHGLHDNNHPTRSDFEFEVEEYVSSSLPASSQLRTPDGRTIIVVSNEGEREQDEARRQPQLRTINLPPMGVPTVIEFGPNDEEEAGMWQKLVSSQFQTTKRWVLDPCLYRFLVTQTRHNCGWLPSQFRIRNASRGIAINWGDVEKKEGGTKRRQKQNFGHRIKKFCKRLFLKGGNENNG
ncbi:hypothetical protein H0H81_004767 [Sphagnurus paluster]|uniref:Protein kinase domain-containing protein n=1 Tax=Sphagnurus paluster TaxID=117069 RepID=A0A9P7FY70_9AGAR|nr:hypothetical protein H0H81_004767 [Sphagnurus paluster]